MFIDVIERVKVLISNTGQLLHADVEGVVPMKVCDARGVPCVAGWQDGLLAGWLDSNMAEWMSDHFDDL